MPDLVPSKHAYEKYNMRQIYDIRRTFIMSGFVSLPILKLGVYCGLFVSRPILSTCLGYVKIRINSVTQKHNKNKWTTRRRNHVFSIRY